MSEPVGNSSRGTPLPGSNTHVSKMGSAKPEVSAEEREKVNPVIQGKVVQKKSNAIKRFARGVVADDVNSVGDFIVAEVLIPAIRNVMYDIVAQGAHRVLFGTARGRRTGLRTYSIDSPVQNLKMAYNRVSSEPERSRHQISREDQARHNFDELILESRSDAVEVLENLIARVDRYGSASVADLYDYLGVTGGFTDQNYGWTNLSNADVRHTRRGYTFDLPRPIALKR